MTAEDLDRVTEIEAASFSTPWTRAMIVSELANTLSRVFVAEVDGRVEGFVIAWLVADEIHVLDLAVNPSLRRGGVGRELTRAALETGAREGAAYAVLEVRRSNAAARLLYRGMGFRIIGRRAGYYQDNGEDALVMMTTLAGEEAGGC